MPDVPGPVIELVRRRREPVVVQTLRSTAAATIAYAAALWLTDARAPLLAPLTALLVVQVTLYATITSGITRVNAVVAGVTVAVGFSALVGLSWWSLGLLILTALVVGHLVRAGDFINEVAISAMLVLGVTRATDLALNRVLETLIGAAVGLLFNLLFVPPVWVQPAEEALQDLAGRVRGLLLRMREPLGSPVPVHRAAARLHEARRLDNDITRVDEALVQAEESLRLNPRVKEGLLSRVVLRTGLDTLEICTAVTRAMSRTLTDLAAHRRDEPLFPPDVAAATEELFDHLADAVHNFAVLVTSPLSSSSEKAENRLAEAMEAGRASREKVAHLLLARTQEHPRQWHLQGALLAEADRLLDELDVEKRSTRLAEELDRYTREERDRHPVLYELKRRLRVPRRRRRRRSTTARAEV
ncbi:aromatic acid exporter family protein [Streptomyces sp. TRM 70361]|uniref:FUSC family protein n=1 Tax=Streptomyces sp. TRM 70361 TaxID=3116553 RepID=UPI002E7AD94E|nr:aromatic acid exporter family protein [Streptomyces sp. TRM 70361]MEE1941213.1 aromatic acid exporter family protein [Streptomyces sp. TRM 70361]